MHSDHSRYVDGVGVVCDYSLFDFNRHGDEDFGADKWGFLDEVQRANDGKLEKSFLNFQQANPNFEPGPAAKNVLNKFQQFKDSA